MASSKKRVRMPETQERHPMRLSAIPLLAALLVTTIPGEVVQSKTPTSVRQPQQATPAEPAKTFQNAAETQQIIEKLRWSNVNFQKNYVRVLVHLRSGAAKALYNRLHAQDEESGGYITIDSGGAVNFKFVENPLNKLFDNAISAIRSNQPVPDYERVLHQVDQAARDLLPEDRPERFTAVVSGYEAARTIIGIETNGQFLQIKSGLITLLKLFRNHSFQVGYYISNPGYVSDWHHHPSPGNSGERLAPSTRDLQNTVLRGPDIVLELGDGGMFVHGLLLGRIIHTERITGL